MVDIYIRLPIAFLYGQPPFGSPSSLGPSSTPGVARMSEDEFTSKRLSMISTKAFCVIFNVPNYQLRLKAQPVYQVSSPRLLWGISYLTRHGSVWMPRPILQSQCHLHERLYSIIPCHPQPCEKHKGKSYTAPYLTLPRSLPIIRRTAVCSFFDHTVIC